MKRKNKEEAVILVYYIDVRDIETNDLENFMKKVMKQIQTETIEAEIISIPVWGETKVECINPKYISKKELIKEHEEKMKKLHDNINYFIVGNKLEKDGR